MSTAFRNLVLDKGVALLCVRMGLRNWACCLLKESGNLGKHQLQ